MTDTKATPQLETVPAEIQFRYGVEVAARAHIVDTAGLNNIGHFNRKIYFDKIFLIFQYKMFREWTSSQ